MMIINEFWTLRPIDRLLVVCFIIYAVCVIAALYAVNRELIRRDARRAMERVICRMEALDAWVHRDQDEAFDPIWMDAEKYREAMRGR